MKSIHLNDFYEANVTNNKQKNDYELEILNKYEITAELIDIIIRRSNRIKSSNYVRPKQDYSKQRTQIIKHLKNKYETDDEYKSKVKRVALEYYNNNKEDGKQKRREYYHKHKDRINLKNKERNRLKREALNNSK